MARLPVIVGIGGINPAGRVSFHHAYRRMVIDALPAAAVDSTYRSLARLMDLNDDPALAATRAYIREHTLVRRNDRFDVARMPWNRAAKLRTADGHALSFELRKRDLPDALPTNWQVTQLDDAMVRVLVDGDADVFLPDLRPGKVSSAGQLPTGFAPDRHYPARSHPRGLQLAIWGASDALRSVGIPLEVLKAKVPPDAIAVYSGSAMGQLDFDGSAGMLQSHLIGKRQTSKQVALGLPEMPADFVNAYVLGSVGCTGANIGACATFLYNLRLAVDDIQSGRRRMVVVGNSEAPIIAEIIEGYRTMGALAEDDALMALDGRTDEPDYRRAVRPFSDNCGFTVAEAGVYTVLFDDELAIEMGANILGAVGDVFVNADGYKKSIPGPGIGNYLTIAKALALTEAIIGTTALRTRSFVQAHGTSTPQNRVTESHILSELAQVFRIDAWTVTACKAFLGHTLAPAGADQLASTLGVFHDGVLPGITTIDHIAADVHTKALRFPMQHTQVGADGMDAAIVNSKGFGGNNASGVILAPHVVRRMLAAKHGQAALTAHQKRNESVQSEARAYDERMTTEGVPPIYRFGEGVVEGEELRISRDEIRIPGFGLPVSLALDSPYPDMKHK